MTARILFIAALLPLSAGAQIQIFQFDGTNDTPVGALYDVGSAAVGDTITTRFHVKNVGSDPQYLQPLALSTSGGFTISESPSPIPFKIASESEAEFRVAFSPTTTDHYGAFLTVSSMDPVSNVVDNLNIALTGAGVPAAVLTLTGSNTPLAAGSVIDFGSVAKGTSKSQGFMLANTGTSTLNVTPITVAGTGSAARTALSRQFNLRPARPYHFKSYFNRNPASPPREL